MYTANFYSKICFHKPNIYFKNGIFKTIIVKKIPKNYGSAQVN